jgi:hypothetical protein
MRVSIQRLATAAALTAIAIWLHGSGTISAQSQPTDASRCSGGSCRQCEAGQTYVTWTYAYQYNGVKTSVATGQLPGYSVGAYYDCTYPFGNHHGAPNYVCAGDGDSFSVQDGGSTWNLSWENECVEVDLEPCAGGPSCSQTQNAVQYTVDCGPGASAVIAK